MLDLETLPSDDGAHLVMRNEKLDSYTNCQFVLSAR
jgi:hypothetical protein